MGNPAFADPSYTGTLPTINRFGVEVGPDAPEPTVTVDESASSGAEWDTPLQPPPPSSYSFGFGGSSLSSGGVISHSELLIWLEQYTGHMSEQQRDLMMGVEQRNKLVEDLSFLKQLIVEGEGIGDSQAQAQELLDAYEGTPYYDQLGEVLGGIINDGNNYYSSEAATQHTGNIQTVIDSLQKADQIAMIQLQDVVSNIGRNVQAVSQVIAADNQTTLAIIANVGR